MNAVWQSHCSRTGSLEHPFTPAIRSFHQHGRVPEWFRGSPALHPSASSARGESRGFNPRHGRGTTTQHGRVPEWFRGSPAKRVTRVQFPPRPPNAGRARPSSSGARLRRIHQRAPLAGSHAGSIPATASKCPDGVRRCREAVPVASGLGPPGGPRLSLHCLRAPRPPRPGRCPSSSARSCPGGWRWGRGWSGCGAWRRPVGRRRSSSVRGRGGGRWCVRGGGARG